MPFSAFKCKVCQQVLTVDAALEHFPYAHIADNYALPATLIQLLADSEGDGRRTGASLSPSMALGCMREVAIKRTYDYTIEPLSMWKAQQGTIFHAGLASQARTGHTPAGWYCEVLMPPDGVPVELWPGIALTTRIDLISSDGSKLHDYKTQACYEKKGADGAWHAQHFAPSEMHTMQLNLEALVVERVTGKRPTELALWKIMLGTKDEQGAWRLQQVAVLSEDQIKREVVDGPNGMAAFVTVMSTTEGAEREAAIKSLPLAGRTMFNGKKCTSYCSVKQQCDALLGVDERW